jgi:hypothetical protein
MLPRDLLPRLRCRECGGRPVIMALTERADRRIGRQTVGASRSATVTDYIDFLTGSTVFLWLPPRPGLGA